MAPRTEPRVAKRTTGTIDMSPLVDEHAGQSEHRLAGDRRDHGLGEDGHPHPHRPQRVDQVEQEAGDAALVGGGRGGEEGHGSTVSAGPRRRRDRRTVCAASVRPACGSASPPGPSSSGDRAGTVVPDAVAGRRRRADRVGRPGRRGAAPPRTPTVIALPGRAGPRAGQRPLARADGAVPRPGRGPAAGPLAAGGDVAAGGPADGRRRRGRDDRRLGGDARQRHHHERRDVLPPRADRRRRRRRREPARHPRTAGAAAGDAARWTSSCRPPSSWPRGAPADGSVEYGLGPHAAYTVPLPVLRDAARRGAGARAAAAPARRRDRR